MLPPDRISPTRRPAGLGSLVACTASNASLLSAALMIPAFTVLFPGTATGWIQALPSYPLVQGLVKVATYGDGWAEALPDVGALLAWCIALFVLGWVVLKRKVETL